MCLCGFSGKSRNEIRSFIELRGKVFLLKFCFSIYSLLRTKNFDC